MYRDGGNRSSHIHLLFDKTGRPHQLASKTCITVNEIIRAHSSDLHIFGELMGIVRLPTLVEIAQDENAPRDLWVWNWKTGELLQVNSLDC